VSTVFEECHALSTLQTHFVFVDKG
jgi:hypothetical protein